MFAESFPTSVRYSEHAAASAIGYPVGAGPTPFVAAALLHWTGTSWSIAALLAVSFGISLVVLPFVREIVGVDIEAPYDSPERPQD
ncbi:MAG: hypothetical protein AUI14_10340 [Actinobacteria bacterium 13_2_20CM_2_71_6]|nr:MAG: hypothetical protein AUI14_10340 [Actinobacteria bacterium 13_2_20CM_2_71_6]